MSCLRVRRKRPRLSNRLPTAALASTDRRTHPFNRSAAVSKSLLQRLHHYRIGRSFGSRCQFHPRWRSLARCTSGRFLLLFSPYPPNAIMFSFSSLVGCQDLLSDIPGRCRYDPGGLVDGSNSSSGSKSKAQKFSSKGRTYSVAKDEQCECYAIIRLDNKKMSETEKKPVSQQAWDQRFTIELDKARMFFHYTVYLQLILG